MNKKQRIIILAILLFFPVFVHADIIHLQSQHHVNRGEFASPIGIFNSKLNVASSGEFATQGLFSNKSKFKVAPSAGLKSFSGIFNRGSSEFRGLDSSSKAPQGDFSSNRLISGAGQSMIAKNSFKSPDQGDFKFSLPK